MTPKIYDEETLKAELTYIHSSVWYERLLREMYEYRDYYVRSLLSCEDIKELGVLQGRIKAADDMIAKIIKED